MLKVGLTGGIGSGKTTVAKVFINLGIPVFIADDEARILMETSEELIHAIKGSFGDATYKGHELNRKFLANIVFTDPERLKKLNQIIHPAVHRRFEEWCKKQKNVPYVVEDAALLYESGAWKFFDYMVLVSAPQSQRIERVMKRDGVTGEDVLSRMRSQMPDEEKIPYAHFLIFNDDQNLVTSQVLACHEKLISLNKK